MVLLTNVGSTSHSPLRTAFEFGEHAMNDQSSNVGSNTPSRRDFLKQSAVVAGSVAGLASSARAFAGGSDVIRVGLIGCGGRGTGAAAQALRADKGVQLVAMGDAFADRLSSSHSTLKAQKDLADRVQVDNDHRFVGIDAYKSVIEASDVVLLTTPPHFRPAQLKAAIEAGKHVFCEKPVAVDGPGVRSVIETAKLAAEKNLTIVSGLCWRYHHGKRAAFERIHGGEIGDITSMRCSYLTGGLWTHPRQPSWSDFEFQLRNWLYYTYLSGDHITEQHIHSLDKMGWAMKDQTPIRASGTGGRQTRLDPIYGHIYDHFAVEYEYENGVRAFSRCRQQDGCQNDVTDHIYGTKGFMDVMGHKQYDYAGNLVWRFKGNGGNMYQIEHDEMFAALRAGKTINNGDYMAKSTLMAVMGRMAAYTGKTITWQQALNSKEDLTPASYDFGPMDMPKVPMPGITPFA
jgi:predicted dehydrogenase